MKKKLKRYLKLHSGKYLFVLYVKSFAQKGNLKIHMRRHSGECPY
ncbi:hypothetical protein X975_00413, partial [Stegodyphus mimosarum]